MDRERTKKDHQEAFEATWRSYRTAMENALTLEEQTLAFARGLIETPAGAWRKGAERNHAMLNTLTEQPRRQREVLESMVRGSANTYTSLLQAPFSYYRRGAETTAAPEAAVPDAVTPPEVATSEAAVPEVGEPEAAAPPETRITDVPGSQLGGEPPLEGYDSLSVRQVSERLDELSVEKVERLRAYEAENKNRRTLLKHLDARLEAESTF